MIAYPTGPVARLARTGVVALGLGLCGCVTAVASPPPWANAQVVERSYDRPISREYDDARVVAVEPIVRQVRVESPRRECREEVRTVYREREGHGSTAAPMIIGGIIGGAIGSQVGQGRGRDIATVAGTLIGASIGHDSAVRSGRDAQPEERVVERCETRYDSSYRERVDGYRVTYEYQGREYTTRLPYDPGDRIRVRVAVTPAEY
jgi:uncharacterized protein YcfJ